MTAPSRWIVGDAVRRADIDALAGATGWRKVHEAQRTHEAFRTVSWEPAPSGGTVSWVEDHVFGVRLVTAAPGADIQPLRAHLAIVERTKLVERARPDDDI